MIPKRKDCWEISSEFCDDMLRECCERRSLRGIEPVIAHQKNEKARQGRFDRKSYRRRKIVERCINSLKWFRRVATRYEKLATHDLGMVTLAIIFRLL